MELVFFLSFWVFIAAHKKNFLLVLAKIKLTGAGCPSQSSSEKRKLKPAR